MNTDKFAIFSQAYKTGLIAAVTKEPELYLLPKNMTAEEGALVTANKMLSAIADRPMMVNYDSKGMKLACKALGIKNTRKAIFEYLEIKS